MKRTYPPFRGLTITRRHRGRTRLASPSCVAHAGRELEAILATGWTVAAGARPADHVVVELREDGRLRLHWQAWNDEYTALREHERIVE